MEIPKLFISYSHDSPEHKKWVLDLATRLRYNGIDSILDQWELKPGDDIPSFAESNLSSANFIAMICTSRYTIKANQGTGGVGYEKMIITANLMKNINEAKIIPIIRQNDAHDLPVFLKTKLFLDFSSDEDFEVNFDEFVRLIHQAPLFQKPEIGNNPFLKDVTIDAIPKSDGVNKLMRVVIDEYEAGRAISYPDLKAKLGISRIMYEFLIKEVRSKKYISVNSNNRIQLEDTGKAYAMKMRIVD